MLPVIKLFDTIYFRQDDKLQTHENIRAANFSERSVLHLFTFHKTSFKYLPHTIKILNDALHDDSCMQ